MTIGYPGAAIGTDARGLTAILNRINLGKLNCAGTLTLAAGQTATVVADSRAGAGSFIGLVPLTANAAAEIAAGTLYLSSRSSGSFELTHASSAATDRHFAFVILG